MVSARHIMTQCILTVCGVDDFMPVDPNLVEAASGVGDLAPSTAPMELLASGTQLPFTSVKPEPTDRERMAAAGCSSQQIDQVLNCARCFQLAHLMHSSPAGFAATCALLRRRRLCAQTFLKTQLTCRQVVTRALWTPLRAGMMCHPPCAWRARSRRYRRRCAAQHAWVEVRQHPRAEWYKNLHAAYETAKQMNVGNEGHASEATLRHAVYNGVDTDFVNWVAANVDADNKLTKLRSAPRPVPPALRSQCRRRSTCVGRA